jgi:hypothetical protein
MRTILDKYLYARTFAPDGAEGGEGSILGGQESGEANTNSEGDGEETGDEQSGSDDGSGGDGGDGEDAASGEEDDADKKSDEEEDKGEDEEEDEISPEDYVLETPEGMTVDPDMEADFREFAAEKKLSQEDVDRMVEMQAGAHKRMAKQTKDNIAGWQKSLREDPEFGGAEYDKNVGLANSVVNEVFTSMDPNFSGILARTGFGNHPTFVKGMMKIGQAFGEAGIQTGKATDADTTIEERLYGGK